MTSKRSPWPDCPPPSAFRIMLHERAGTLSSAEVERLALATFWVVFHLAKSQHGFAGYADFDAAFADVFREEAPDGA